MMGVPRANRTADSADPAPGDEGASRPAREGEAIAAETFASLGLAAALLRNIARLGWSGPTPIQSRAFGPVHGGRDVLGLARTGSGKTAAFLLPVIDVLLRERRGGAAGKAAGRRRRAAAGRRRGVQSLVLCPTRELAVQVAASAEALLNGTGESVACLHGKVALRPQVERLTADPALVVATPGRAIELLETGALQLDRLRTCVLDEADRMLDMGLGPQVAKILDASAPDRQTILFTATMPPDVAALADGVLREPVRIEIDPTGTVASHVRQRAYRVEDAVKTRLLIALLAPADRPGPRTGGVLVFCRTRRRAHWVGAALARHGVTVGYLHGDRSHTQRTKALEAFRGGRCEVLLATDVAARGLHVESVRTVVQYDLPIDPVEHVHRIGRAAHGLEGRGGGGEAVSFVAQHEIDCWSRIRALGAAPSGFEALPDAVRAAEPPAPRLRERGEERPPSRRGTREPRKEDRASAVRGAARNEEHRSRRSRPIGKSQRPGAGARRPGAG